MGELSDSVWHEEWKLASARPLFLDLIDSRFHQNGFLPPPELFHEEFQRWMGNRAYDPDSRGDPAARKAVAEFYRGQGIPLEPCDVFLTAGTSEAYSTVFSTFCLADETVGLPRPGYPLFEHLAQRSRLGTHFYDQPFQWPAEAPTDLRFLVVISPNNPTGHVYSQTEWERIGAFCLEKDLILICDEVFDAFLGPDTELPRAARVLPQVKTITVNGISKRFGSPDLKLAWMVLTGPRDWVLEAGRQLEFANDLFLTANSFSQSLLPRLFAELGPWQAGLRTTLEINRLQLDTWLDDHPEIVAPRSQGGIHGLLRWPSLPRGWDDERLAIHLLRSCGLGLHPGFLYDIQNTQTLVYSLLKRPADFSEGLRRLNWAVKNLGGFP